MKQFDDFGRITEADGTSGRIIRKADFHSREFENHVRIGNPHDLSVDYVPAKFGIGIVPQDHRILTMGIARNRDMVPVTGINP